MRNHTTIAWQHRMHTEFLHTVQNLLLQLFLTVIPRKGQRTTPSFQIVHLPPSQESRTRNKLSDFLFVVTQAQQHLPPHAFLSYDSQWQIHTMQGHPINFLFPSVPIPEGHGIREGAIIEIVAQRKIGLMTFRFLYFRQHSRQLCFHLIP